MESALPTDGAAAPGIARTGTRGGGTESNKIELVLMPEEEERKRKEGATVRRVMARMRRGERALHFRHSFRVR